MIENITKKKRCTILRVLTTNISEMRWDEIKSWWKWMSENNKYGKKGYFSAYITINNYNNDNNNNHNDNKLNEGEKTWQRFNNNKKKIERKMTTIQNKACMQLYL